VTAAIATYDNLCMCYSAGWIGGIVTMAKKNFVPAKSRQKPKKESAEIWLTLKISRCHRTNVSGRIISIALRIDGNQR
jgi:hypothetical protein